ncbi:MAG: helix-turn-helix transcriptional regulator, partial [Clostridia bacterium]|nr:helix-turn-helix transcriptional regulator [Clostridia bacterium]
FIKIYNLWSAKKPGYYARSMAVLYEIIDEFKNSREKYISKGQRDALDAAYAYILENYRKRDFDYNALCSASGFSYSHFKELFIKHFRLSPVKYVTKMRISYACDLLVSGMYSVTEISSMCGFDNVYYFSRVFKNEMGVTPGKYGCEV